MTLVDEQIIKIERQKARDLRHSRWWQTIINTNPNCHYCAIKLDRETVTMDHLVPVSRGGRSTRGNVVPACKPCNSSKKSQTPVEMILEQLNLGKNNPV